MLRSTASVYLLFCLVTTLSVRCCWSAHQAPATLAWYVNVFSSVPRFPKSHLNDSFIRMFFAIVRWVQAPAVRAQTDAEQFFVHHGDATGVLRKGYAAFFKRLFPTQIPSEAAFQAKMDEVYGVQLGNTLTRLAAGLPIYSVKVVGKQIIMDQSVAGAIAFGAACFVFAAIIALAVSLCVSVEDGDVSAFKQLPELSEKYRMTGRVLAAHQPTLLMGLISSALLSLCLLPFLPASASCSPGTSTPTPAPSPTLTPSTPKNKPIDIELQPQLTETANTVDTVADVRV